MDRLPTVDEFLCCCDLKTGTLIIGPSLGYGVKSSAGSEWHSGVSISSTGIRISGISSISSVSTISSISPVSSISTIGEGISSIAVAVIGISICLGIGSSDKANQNN